MSLKEYEKIVKNAMSKKRYEHSLNVSKEAVKLAKLYKADVKKCAVAGILHDITKEMPMYEQLQIINNSDIILTPLQKETSKLWHAISGSIYVKDKLAIKDKDIINAIKYHTSGRAGMSKIEKIVFVADFIGEDRTYNGVEIMRKKAQNSLEEAMLYGVSFSITDLVSRGLSVEPSTLDLYNELILNK